MTPTHFDSDYNVGDTVYILFDDGFAGSVQLTAIGFTPGFNPVAFNPNTDFTYTTNKLSTDAVNYITRTQEQCFATKQLMSAYILALP